MLDTHTTTSTPSGLALALRSVGRDISETTSELSGAAAVISLARESSLRLPGAEDIAEALAFVRERIDAELLRLRAAGDLAAIWHSNNAEARNG